MKKNNILIIWLFIISILSGHNLMAQQGIIIPPPTPMDYLTAATWQLKEIEVDTNYYYDQAIPVLEFTFDSTSVMAVTDSASVTIPWEFSSTDPNQIIFNAGTSEQQLFYIQFLNENFFIYKVDYDINGTIYSYLFKFISL